VGVQVRPFSEFTLDERRLVEAAQLGDLAAVEAWSVTGTNRQLAYSTHGVFRFFGKFPPPIARKLIENFTAEGDWVLDPMMGSGTTAVEALALGRNCVGRDVSPLSTLLCRVKTRHISGADSHVALASVIDTLDSIQLDALPEPVGLRDASHWFLPETRASLGRIRAAIDRESNEAIRELLLVAFISTVRRVSKATTQQGRLFLDIAKAKSDALPTFCDRFERYSAAVATLPAMRAGQHLIIEECDAKTTPELNAAFRLAIVHPPYFNNYKYSSINSLELAWLGIAPKSVRAAEIRESFKVGKPEKVAEYVADLADAIAAVAKQLAANGTLALMMGDTMIREQYLSVTRQLCDALVARGTDLRLTRVVLRIPQYTEASWVASQRRTGDKVGVTLNDFVLIFQKSPR
jgi:hypothetical protein